MSKSSIRNGRALLAALIFAGLSSGLAAQSPETAQHSAAAQPSPLASLEEQIRGMITASEVARAHWGIAVSTLDGNPILTINAGQFFEPASNNKLLTTSAAMALLGPEATVVTRVIGQGKLQNGTLTGDLVLEGSGDANFGTQDVPYLSPAMRRQTKSGPAAASAAPPEPHPLRALEQLADAVVKAGVTVVTGDVLGDDTVFPSEPYPEAWAVDDLPWGYGAPVSGLAIHDNQMELTVRPGPAIGAPAVAEFERGLPSFYSLDLSGLVTTAAKSETRIAIDRAVGSRLVRVWGTVALDAKPELQQLAIDDPAGFAAEALRGMLVARGVQVRGVARAKHRLPQATLGFRRETEEPLSLGDAGTQGTSTDPAATGCGEDGSCVRQVLASVRSPTLADDEVVTNKTSQNLHAELLLLRLGAAFGAGAAANGSAGGPRLDPGSRAEGVRVVRAFAERAGIDPKDVVLFDGSGLSTHDLVTPRALVRLLVYAAGQPWFAAWKATLPVGGEDGTLAGRFPQPPLKDHLFAKTGTLGESRALSGYLDCANGNTVAFSVLVDQHAPGEAADREVMDRIVAAIQAAH